MSLDELEMSNIYSKDTSKVLVIGELTSMKLLGLSKEFDMYPGGEVDIE